MPSVTCVKCGKKGSLVVKPTKNRGRTYHYWYVEHWNKPTAKRSWCYIGELSEEYKRLIGDGS